MSEGVWEDTGDLSEWEDGNVELSEGRSSEAWGDPPGANAPTEVGAVAEIVEPETPAPLEVSESDVMEALAEEGEVEDAPAERQRDEKGRFLPKEPEALATEAVTEPQQEQPLYAGKLKSVEELERAYLELEQHLGRSAQERSELNALRQELAAMREEINTPKVSIPSNWTELLDDNPAQAAKVALDAGDRQRYEEAKEAWELESPGAPEIYEQNLMLNYELGQLRERVDATQVPQTRAAEVEATAQALRQVKATHEDFDKFEGEMAQVMQDRPLYMDALKNAVQVRDVAAQAAIFSDLYSLVAGRRSDNLTQAQAEENRLAAERQRQARQEAVVVSATGTATEVKKSEADLIADEWDKLDAPYASGWLEP